MAQKSSNSSFAGKWVLLYRMFLILIVTMGVGNVYAAGGVSAGTRAGAPAGAGANPRELEKPPLSRASHQAFKEFVEGIRDKKWEDCEKNLDILLGDPKGRKNLRDFRYGGKISFLSQLGNYASSTNDAFGPLLLSSYFSKILSTYFEDRVSFRSDDFAPESFNENLMGFLLSSVQYFGNGKAFFQYLNTNGKDIRSLGRRFGDAADIDQAIREIDYEDALFPADADERDREGLKKQRLLRSKMHLITSLSAIPDCFGATLLMMSALFAEDISMVGASLNHFKALGLNINQQDCYGNTAESIYERVKKDGLDQVSKELAAQYFKAVPLNRLWGQIVNEGCFLTEHMRKNFIKTAIHVALSQNQGSLHMAFFQEDVTTHREEANELWRDFLKTYDEAIRDSDNQEEKVAQRFRIRMPLAVRALDSFSFVDSSDYGATAGRILAGNSTFGMNFSRTLTQEEAYLTVHGILYRAAIIQNQIAQSIRDESLENTQMTERFNQRYRDVKEKWGVDLENMNTLKSFNPDAASMEGVLAYLHQMSEKDAQILSSESGGELSQEQIKALGIKNLSEVYKRAADNLFHDYPFEIDEARRTKLFNHQLNCAVVTLYPLALSMKYNVSDSIEPFIWIDEQLQDRMPEGQVVNSGHRFAKLKERYPDAFSELELY